MTDELTVPVSARDHAVGPADAPITLVEYGDFECPFCGAAYPVVKEIRRRLGERLRFVFRHFPRPEHPHARHAAESAEAAATQGEPHFWHMHDWMFEHQDTLADSDLVGAAGQLGLDVNRFRQDLERHTYLERVRADLESGAHNSVHGTPTFFINGRKHEGPDTLEDLLGAIHATQPETTNDSMQDPVDEASRESFPASDPPGWVRSSL